MVLFSSRKMASITSIREKSSSRELQVLNTSLEKYDLQLVEN